MISRGYERKATINYFFTNDHLNCYQGLRSQSCRILATKLYCKNLKFKKGENERLFRAYSTI